MKKAASNTKVLLIFCKFLLISITQNGFLKCPFWFFGFVFLNCLKIVISCMLIGATETHSEVRKRELFAKIVNT